MTPVACDMCAKSTRGNSPLARHGGLSLCARCAGLFGGASHAAVQEDPGSLAAFSLGDVDEAAATRAAGARPSERNTLAVERDAESAMPTLRVPGPRLDALVRDLDGLFTGPGDEASPYAETARPPPLPAPVERLPSKRRRIDATRWGRGIMASAGITLAVMLAFVSLKSSLPKAAGLPAALAREGAPVVLALPSAWPPSLSAPVAQPTASALAPVTNLEAAPVAAPPTAPAVVPARPTPAPGRPAPATSPKLAIEPADASRAGETSAAAPAETDAVTPVEITVAKQAEPSAAKPAAGETGEPAALPDFGSRD